MSTAPLISSDFTVVPNPWPIPHAVAALPPAQSGGPRGAEHAFQALYGLLVRQQPEVLQ